MNSVTVPLNGDAGGFVVGGVSVMGEQGAGGKQQRKQRERSGELLHSCLIDITPILPMQYRVTLLEEPARECNVCLYPFRSDVPMCSSFNPTGRSHLA